MFKLTIVLILTVEHTEKSYINTISKNEKDYVKVNIAQLSQNMCYQSRRQIFNFSHLNYNGRLRDLNL